MIEATTNQAIAALVVADSRCRAYLKLALASDYESIRTGASGGVQPNLNLDVVRRIAVPLPSAAEQERIVTEVERLVSDVEATERSVTRQIARADRLRQSILKRTFEGKLVPQDSNDEPASVLLERIRAERADKLQRVNRAPKPKKARAAAVEAS